MSEWRARSIFHFILPCSDIDVSAAFYAHFGFEVIKDNRDVQWPDYVGSNFNMVPRAVRCSWCCPTAIACRRGSISSSG